MSRTVLFGMAWIVDMTENEATKSRGPSTAKQFWEVVTQNQLLPEAEIDAWAERVDTFTCMEELAEALIQSKTLTLFQSRMILRGKAKSLWIGRYVVQDKIGAGGMGQVYKAYHHRMNREAAIKLLPPEMVSDQSAIQRFHREAQAAARLSHPNIVMTYDAGEMRGVHYLVMEFIDGVDFSKLVKTRGPMPVSKAITYILQAAEGLQYAHEKGIIHRDIKPHNILLGLRGTVKILDMGLARFDETAGEDSLTETGTIMGTLDYMSPEQALDTRDVDARTDIYSLGCTLFFLLGGRPPFHADTAMKKLLAHRESPIPSLRDANKTVSAALDSVFQIMMAKRPDDRFSSMEDVITGLRNCHPDSSSATIPAPTQDPKLSQFLQGLSSEESTKPSKSDTQRTSSDAAADETIPLSQPLHPVLPAATVSLTQPLETPPESGRVQPPEPTQKPIKKRPWVGISLSVLAVLFVATIFFIFRYSSKAPIKENEPETESVAAVPQLKKTVPDESPQPIEREVAEWTLRRNAQISLVMAKSGELVFPKSVDELPKDDFFVNTIDYRTAPRLADVDMTQLVGLKRIRVLNLKSDIHTLHGPISDVGIRSVGHLTTLRELDLYGSDITADGLKAIAKLTQLTVLLLNNCDIHDDDLRHLAPLTNLQHLNLTGTFIHGKGLKHLSGASKLSVLSLTGYLVDDEIAEPLGQFPRLVHLDVVDTRIGPKTISAISKLKHLERLSLPTTSRVRREQWKPLANLSAYKLRIVDLGESEIGDDALGWLATARKLETLHLYNTQVTASILPTLTQMKNLRILGLKSPHINQQDIEQLSEADPTRIIYSEFGEYGPFRKETERDPSATPTE